MSSSGGIWDLRGKKRSTALPMAAPDHPFPQPRRSCGRDKHGVSQEVCEGSSRGGGFTSHIHMLPHGLTATLMQIQWSL